jgi:hypothetical protein
MITLPLEGAQADLHATRFADLANRLFGVGDEVQQDLDQLIGVANDRRQIGSRREIHAT